MEADKATLIDAHTEVQGKLTGKDARILGRFRGEVELTGRLSTGEGSVVEARVRAQEAEIAGVLTGEVAVRRLALLEKAQVQGTVSAETLSVREGARLEGAINAGPAARAQAERSSGPTPHLAGALKGVIAS
jgi:cytoskeletal protein CcmA (bactofilin family)